MSRVLRNEKVKAISTLVIRTRFARSTKTYTTFTSCQNAACFLFSLLAPSPLPLILPISSSLREFQHGAFASKMRAQRKRLQCRLLSVNAVKLIGL